MTKFSINTAEIPLVAATVKTVLQVSAAANQGLKIASWGVSFDGVIVTEEAVLCELVRSDNGGTGSATPPVAKPLNDEFDGVAQMAIKHNLTAEPTTIDADPLDSFTIHPQGLYQVWMPLGWEFKTSLEAGTADFLNIRCTAPSAVDVVAKLFVEE